MSKTRTHHQTHEEPFRKETPAEFLARGGTITVGTPATGIPCETHELIDRILGASYDDALTQRVSAFTVAAEIRSAIAEHPQSITEPEYV